MRVAAEEGEISVLACLDDGNAPRSAAAKAAKVNFAMLSTGNAVRSAAAGPMAPPEARKELLYCLICATVAEPGHAHVEQAASVAEFAFPQAWQLQRYEVRVMRPNV